MIYRIWGYLTGGGGMWYNKGLGKKP